MIWDKQYEIGVLPGLTDELVKLAEQQLQVKLPAAYIELLKEQNGGNLIHRQIPTTEPNSWAEDHLQIESIYGIAENQGILLSHYLIKEWDLPENLVLISGDGHSWFAFDYRQTNENPPIIYVEVDSEVLFEVAIDFESFVKLLFTYQD